MNKIRPWFILILISVVVFALPVSAQQNQPVAGTLLASLAQVLDSIRLQLLTLQQEVEVLQRTGTNIIPITPVATSTPLASPPSSPSPSPPPAIPTVTVLLDPLSPVGGPLAPGQSNNLLTIIRLTVAGGSPNLNGIQVVSDSANANTNVSNIKVWLGSTLIGTLNWQGFNGLQYYAWFYPSTPITLPNNSVHIISIFGDTPVGAVPGSTFRIGVGGLNFVAPGAFISGLPVYGANFSIQASGAPNAPTNLNVGGLVTPTSVPLVWQDNSNNELGFEIQRVIGLGGGIYSAIATTSANVTSYTDSTVSPNTPYTYRLRAFNAAGYSAFSNTLTLTTPALPPSPVPYAPSDFFASVLPTQLATTSPRRILLNWRDNANNEDGFIIKRGFNPLFFTTIATTTANTNSYQYLFYLDTNSIFPNQPYWYAIQAFNAFGISASSTTSVITPP